MTAAALLRVQDLSVVFPARRGRPPVRAVDRVSFEIQPGETLGLVGQDQYRPGHPAVAAGQRRIGAVAGPRTDDPVAC